MANSFESEMEAGEYETLASLANDLVYRLPGCADVQIRKTIQSVYRDFCKKTCVLSSTRQIELRRGETCYLIRAKYSGCVIDCVTSVSVGGRELGADEYYLRDGVLHVSGLLLPADDAVDYAEVACVEIPKIGSEEIPSWFVQKYGDSINSGVLARLQAMTNKPWSDPNMAEMSMREYESALTETRARHHAGGNLSAGSLNFMGKATII